jgi:chemotaxis protein MotA
MFISFSSLFGVLAGTAILGWGITRATSDWQLFVNGPSAAIVLGGTITSLFIGYRYNQIFAALFAIVRSFLRQKITLQSQSKDIGTIINWSKKYQAEGVKVFEELASNQRNPFLKYAANLVSTGYTLEELETLLENSIEENYYKSLNKVKVLNNMASAAPAFGMIGTLIGLIVMLSNMDDPSQMGPGLSVALVTTLYGVFFARFVFTPTAIKVKQSLNMLRAREYLVLQGILLILQKKSSFYIQDYLNAYLDYSHQYSSDVDRKQK